MKNKDYLICGARVWEPEMDALAPLSTPLLVREGRVALLGAEAEQRAMQTQMRRIDLPGRVIVPGLIDAHVHLELDPKLRTPADQLVVPDAERDLGRAARARAMLAAGITTARDCGGGTHREHALRDAIDAKEAIGPRLLCCGQPITTPDGHCAFWGGGIESEGDLEVVMDRQISAQSDWIKVMVTGGVFTPGSSARDRQFELPMLKRLVERAGDSGRFVAAHCHGTPGIRDAVEAGIRTIEHASFAGEKGFGTDLDEGLMAEMAAASLWASPTVNAGWGRRIEDDQGRPTDFFARMSRCLRLQKEAGVSFIASTDAGIPGVAHHALLDGLLAFARFAELSPVEVLRSATSESALALGLTEETGRVAVGHSADLLILEEDPLESLEALRDPEIVVFRGEMHSREARAAWG
ncbi:MAG: amidohydrolase family protein [Myxococcota bacterium]